MTPPWAPFFSQKNKILFISLFILSTTLIFNAVLSAFSMKTIHTHSVDSLHHVVLLDFKRKVQTALSFGKRLENFIGIEDLITQTRQEFNTVSGITLYDSKGDLIITKGSNYSPPSLDLHESYPQDTPFHTFKEASWRNYCSPIKNSFSTMTEGYVCMHVDDAIVYEKIKAHVLQSLILLVVVFIFGTIVFMLASTRLNACSEPESYRKKITAVLITISLVSQIVFTFFNLRFFYQEHYIDLNYKNTILVSLLKSDVENFLDKKLPIDKIINIEKLMTQMMDIGTDLERLAITNPNNDQLYHIHKDGLQNNNESITLSSADITMPLFKQVMAGEKIIAGYIYAFKDTKLINAHIKDVLINLLTIAFVSVIFMYEFIQFLFFFISNNRKTLPALPKSNISEYRLIRPIIFLFMFAFDLTLSFLAIFAGTLYDSGMAISKELTMGLPLSIEMFFAAIAFIVGGKWSLKHSWARFFSVGILCVSIGSFFSATAHTLLLFLMSRALIGFGYGLVISSLQGYIVQNTTQDNRTQAFGIMLAGLYSGSLCGNATGAILADLVGYNLLFIFSAVLVLVVFLFLRYLNCSIPSQTLHVNSKQHISFWAFISNKNVLGFLILSAIPASAVAMGYVYYFIPVYMQNTDASQADIGRIILLYSVVIIYLAPFFGTVADKVKDKRLIIALSGIVGAMALIGFYGIEDNRLAIVFSILFLGISAGFGYASQMTFASNLKASKAYGASNSMGTIRSIERVGQAIGPLLFASLASSLGGNIAVFIVGIGVLMLAITFYSFVKKEG